MTTPAARPCDACNALPGEPCAPDCIAVPSILAEMEDAGSATPGCLCCGLLAARGLELPCGDCRA